MAKHRESHLYQTLQSMLSAQVRLHFLYGMTRINRSEAVSGKPVDASLVRQVGNAIETQREELGMAAHCLRTMYPAANDPVFEAAL